MTLSQLNTLSEHGIKVYGDIRYRGESNLEGAEHSTFFNQLRKLWPDYAAIAIHPKNDKKRKGRDFEQLKKDKANGMTPGASDINIPGLPSFICELKRKNHTDSQFEKEQIPYLINANNNGAFTCVALGYEAALEAVADWHSQKLLIAEKLKE